MQHPPSEENKHAKEMKRDERRKTSQNGLNSPLPIENVRGERHSMVKKREMTPQKEKTKGSPENWEMRLAARDSPKMPPSTFDYEPARFLEA